MTLYCWSDCKTRLKQETMDEIFKNPRICATQFAPWLNFGKFNQGFLGLFFERSAVDFLVYFTCARASKSVLIVEYH